MPAGAGAGGGAAVGVPRLPEAVAVCDTLRISITRFAGPDGFAALLRRALALARAEAPVLAGVRLGADNRLEGFGEIPPGAEAAEAAVALAAHVLTLLATFIGEPLTVRLLREAWPGTEIEGGAFLKEGEA
jgi:hypothetical protein